MTSCKPRSIALATLAVSRQLRRTGPAMRRASSTGPATHRPNPPHSDPLRSGPTSSDPTRPGPARPDLARPDPTRPGLAMPCAAPAVCQPCWSTCLDARRSGRALARWRTEAAAHRSEPRCVGCCDPLPWASSTPRPAPAAGLGVPSVTDGWSLGAVLDWGWEGWHPVPCVRGGWLGAGGGVWAEMWGSGVDGGSEGGCGEVLHAGAEGDLGVEAEEGFGGLGVGHDVADVGGAGAAEGFGGGAVAGF